MKKTLRWAALVFVILASVMAGRELTAGCINNRNSTMECDNTGQDCYCARTGDGCSACTNIGDGGWSICYYDYHTGDMDCTTYQN
jgi:hypothetical protein